MSWLGSLFGKKNARDMDILSSGGLDGTDALAVPGSSVPEAREIINRAAYEVLNLNGVPKDWVKFEILTLADSAKAYFQLQVTIKHWDAYLLLHSWAFEQAVSARIIERNMAIGRALRAVLWRIAPDAGCPYEKMPPSVAWTPDAIAQRANNVDFLKAKKANPEPPKNWNPPAPTDDGFQATLQVGNHAEADEALKQILAARQAARQNAVE
jgi:hypothetical protein